MEFVDSPDEKDEVLNIENIKIYIDPKATLFFLVQLWTMRRAF